MDRGKAAKGTVRAAHRGIEATASARRRIARRVCIEINAMVHAAICAGPDGSAKDATPAAIPVETPPITERSARLSLRAVARGEQPPTLSRRKRPPLPIRAARVTAWAASSIARAVYRALASYSSAQSLAVVDVVSVVLRWKHAGQDSSRMATPSTWQVPQPTQIVVAAQQQNHKAAHLLSACPPLPSAALS